MEPIILGITQGLTEFLPISSSAHLLIIPYLFGWGESSLAFDVALHAGTLAATLVYFFSTWRSLVVKGLIERQSKEVKLIWLLIIATIPAALIGYFGESVISDVLRDPVIASVMMIVFGLVLWLADRMATLRHDLDQITWKESLVIGLAQALALIPGVSRSGITITAGLTQGLKREEATRFSFLLLAPITFGAVITQLPAVLAAPDKSSFAIGILTSFVAGMAAIHIMLSFVKKYGFKPYIWYRVIMGIIFLLLLWQ